MIEASQKDTHSIVLLLACNDPDNGLHTGRCDCIEVLSSWCDEPLLKLQGSAWRCALLACDNGPYEGVLQFGRLRLPWSNAKTWYGNWCWDVVKVPLEAAAHLLATLQQSKWWDVEEGDTCLFEAWRGEKLDKNAWMILLQQTKEQEYGL
jgi:hypothetical protein